jgi:uncharacterized protein (TIGR00725 family)
VDVRQSQRRSIIIGIMGFGKATPHEQLAYTLGRLVAEAGYTLLTGGGAGVMEAASRGTAEAGGLVIGVLPHDRPTGNYPNPYVHIPIFTGMGEARNAINVNSSDVVICLPGGAGTLSEVALALKRGKRVVVVSWPELVLPPECPSDLVHRAANAEEAMAKVRELLEQA